MAPATRMGPFYGQALALDPAQRPDCSGQGGSLARPSAGTVGYCGERVAFMGWWGPHCPHQCGSVCFASGWSSVMSMSRKEGKAVAALPG